jgi:hypothetical protein
LIFSTQPARPAFRDNEQLAIGSLPGRKPDLVIFPG